MNRINRPNVRLPLAPAEGWVTLGLALLLCLTLAWSLDDARWVLGRDTYLDFLPLAAAGGVLVGFIGPKVGWGRWQTHLIGSIFAALIVPLFVASAAHPQGASFQELYVATAASVVAAYGDIVVRNQASTIQYLHYLLSLGMLIWATSMFASYAVFGHHRPLSAVTVVGLLLIGNMALTINDQLVYLVLFSLAALFLLIRGHVLEEQSEWLRRRIGDPGSIASVYLRGGTAFITVAVAGALILTQTAASKPLAGAWDGVSDGLVVLSRSLQRFLPAGGANRSFGVSFGPNATVQQVWTTDSTLAVTIQRPPPDKADYYWRAVTYDRIELTGWSMSNTSTVVRGPSTSLLDGLADNVPAEGHRELAVTITPEDFNGSTILSPQTPIGVDEPTRITVLGSGYFATIERDGGNGSYELRALVPVSGDEPGQLNEEALRAAGQDYPEEVRDLYLGVAEGSIGPDAKALEDTIVAEARSETPYDLAAQIVKELHSSTYIYQTDVRDVDCAGISTVECFARFKRGFCQYYAATMAVILRDLGVPTRIAQGFLPGSRDPNTGVERILNSNAHAWVEVYFPGYGWVTFDPTGGGVAVIAPLPSGRPVASGSPRPSGSGVLATRPPERDPFANDPSGPAGPGSNRGALGPLVAVAVLLLLVVGGLAFAVWQRGPRGATSADRAYGTVAQLAARFGFGPRPTETVYEFAGALGEVLPTARPELQTVARAKVETAYGRQILSDERLAALRAAQRRLRVILLRLAFRRKGRRR
ncbi:MAG: transglutaminase domain-containing protein [Candidatus Limnocylindrales bacterium]|nr:transglutaminase domain-containing protein [Candidatus Limnocylindrales bacterium]